MEHERAKYAELFSLIYVRTGTSTLKESFQAVKGLVDQAEQSGNQVETLLLLDFYIRSSLEVTTLIWKLIRGKLDFEDERLGLLWGVYSRESTLNIVNGVMEHFGAPEKLQQLHADLQ